MVLREQTAFNPAGGTLSYTMIGKFSPEMFQTLQTKDLSSSFWLPLEEKGDG